MLQKHQCASLRGMLAIDSSFATPPHSHLPAGSSRVCSWAAECVPSPGFSHALKCNEVPSWVTEASHCNCLCRLAACPPLRSSREVLPFLAGQLFIFGKLGPLSLLFKLSFKHELHLKRLYTTPP